MDSDRLPRKLAAILYADVAGYSRLTGDDEDATHRRLREYLDLIAKTIEGHHGQVMHYAGDAVLAKFDAVVDALSSAVSIQEQLKTQNADLPDERKVQFRIGVNSGDVIEDRGDIYGDGVNVAARLESLADAGGICISESVRTAIGKKLDLGYEFMGEQQVKNIEEPVRAYQVSMGAEQVSKTKAPEKPALELPDKPSIAVLPFTNMSGDPEQEYFSDGITEDIITALSRIAGLLVVARHSTMVYKGQAIDMRQVGRDQGVRYVLEGSVRKGGNRVRITAQLIDTTTGHHLWAERYDRELDDIFEVQDEITHRITLELQVQLKEGEQARIWAGGTNNVEAWEYLVRGTDLLDTHIKEDILEARRLYEKALALDPGYAAAWIFLGWTHWEDAHSGWADSRETSLGQALEAVRTALDLEEDNPDAFALLGSIHMLRGEHDQAIAMTEKAVGLAPNHATNTALLSMVLSDSGRPQEAIARIKRAMRLSPIFPPWYFVVLGKGYRLMEQYDSAISAYEEAVKREPESNLARIWLAYVLIEAEFLEKAKSVAEDILSIEPTFSVADWMRESNYTPAEREKLLKNFRKAGLPE